MESRPPGWLEYSAYTSDFVAAKMSLSAGGPAVVMQGQRPVRAFIVGSLSHRRADARRGRAVMLSALFVEPTQWL